MRTFGIVEKVIPERTKDFSLVYRQLEFELHSRLNDLLALDTKTLLENRYNRFRKFGNI